MKRVERAYYKALGVQLARARKARCFTQKELADGIGLSQAALYGHETGTRRISVFTLECLAEKYKTSVDDVLGRTPKRRTQKSRVSPRAIRHAERLQSLSRSNQRFVIRLIDKLE